MEPQPIDFVITWVDGADPVWQAEKEKYKGAKGDSRAKRYRDWDTLRYLFRSIEKHAPFVNRVFLVTCGHLPKWLNADAEKLRIVRHDEYIPEEYLPTFCNRAIDMNFHRIKDLSERFVYFNDDMLLVKDVTENDFFKGSLPRETAVVFPAVANRGGKETKTDAMYLAPLMDTALINKHFKKHRAVGGHFFKWYSPVYGKELFKTLLCAPWGYFPGIRAFHACYSSRKSIYEELWAKEGEALDAVCRHRFRVNTDYNQMLFSFWQMAKGEFAPRRPSFGKAYSIFDDPEKNENTFRTIEKSSHKMICLNDDVAGEFEPRLKELTDRLTKWYPEKSSFEL